MPKTFSSSTKSVILIGFELQGQVLREIIYPFVRILVVIKLYAANYAIVTYRCIVYRDEKYHCTQHEWANTLLHSFMLQYKCWLKRWITSYVCLLLHVLTHAWTQYEAHCTMLACNVNLICF